MARGRCDGTPASVGNMAYRGDMAKNRASDRGFLARWSRRLRRLRRLLFIGGVVGGLAKALRRGSGGQGARGPGGADDLGDRAYGDIEDAGHGRRGPTAPFLA